MKARAPMLAAIVIALVAFTTMRPGNRAAGLPKPSAPSAPGAATLRPAPARSASGSGGRADDPGAIEDTIQGHKRDFWVEFEGTVDKLLPDDTDGPEHQRFIVKLASGDTVLVSHNIDVAKRIDAKVGDKARIRGQYEWNERGGVVHFTHRDSFKGRERGWVEVRGVKYE